MAVLIVKLTFENHDKGTTAALVETFNTCDDLTGEIEEKADAWVEGTDSDNWEYDGHTVLSYDKDYADPDKFDNLDAYGEYIALCEKHGEAYQLRFDDTGLVDCWSGYEQSVNTLEEYGRDYYDNQGIEFPDDLRSHIDWGGVANDLLTDHSVYEGDSSFHIFSDC